MIEQITNISGDIVDFFLLLAKTHRMIEIHPTIKYIRNKRELHRQIAPPPPPGLHIVQKPSPFRVEGYLQAGKKKKKGTQSLQRKGVKVMKC